MLGLPDDRFRLADNAVRVDELGWFQESAAVIALISAGSLKTAERAAPLNESVGQEPLIRLAVG